MSGNPVKGEVTFEVSGVTHTLQFSIEALATLEDLLNKPTPLIVSEIASQRVGTIRGALWAGLQAHHPKITVHEAGELLRQLKIAPAMALVAEAISKAFPKDEEAAGENGTAPPPAGEAGTGPAS